MTESIASTIYQGQPFLLNMSTRSIWIVTLLVATYCGCTSTTIAFSIQPIITATTTTTRSNVLYAQTTSQQEQQQQPLLFIDATTTTTSTTNSSEMARWNVQSYRNQLQKQKQQQVRVFDKV
jgi:hypothetical protein